MLAYLATDPQRVHARNNLASLLWPEVPDGRSKQSLREALYRIRKAVDSAPLPTQTASNNESESVLLVDRQSIRFSAPETVETDVTAFQSLIEVSKNHAHHDLEQCASCLASLRSAVELYRGDLLEGLAIDDAPPFDEWLLLLRERLKNQAIWALEQLVEAYQTRQNHDDAVHIAFRLITLDSYREPSHRAVMRALASQGLQDRALDHYGQFCALLLDELGATPSDETKRLAAWIEAGEVGPNSDVRPLARPPIASPNDEPKKHPSEGNQASPPKVKPGPFLQPRNPDFLGRDSELLALANVLLPGQNAEPRTVVLSGDQGVGKSELAREFGHRYSRHFPEGIFWVGFEDAAEEADAGVAAALSEGGTEIFGGAQDGGDRLLILDNCDDYEVALDWLSHSASMSVLLTSRRSSWPTDYPGTELRLTTVARRREVVIVDDVASNLEVLSAVLREDGYEVRPAISGAIALTAIKAAPPDLILLDITMPVMSGIEVCEALKNDPQSRDIPVIFISALTDSAEKMAAFRAGGVDYITKPFRSEEVLARVGLHMRLHNVTGRLRG